MPLSLFCFVFDDMSVAYHLTSVISPPPVLCDQSVRTVVKFFFRGEVGFLNCDDICMCVVNKQVEPLEVFKFRLC